MEKEKFIVKFAETEQEFEQTYALRYNDMLKEYRPDLQNESGLDITSYDAYAKQAICIDTDTGEVVGCYRIISSEWLKDGQKFTSEEEFDISEIKATGEKTVELSRAVVKKEYRNSKVLLILLRFVMQYILKENFRYILGEASFFGTDKELLKDELSYLAHFHSVQDFNIVAREENQIELLPEEQLNQSEIKRKLPALIRTYLGFGATVSKTSFTDWGFGSVDVFVFLDTQNYNEFYLKRLLKL